MIISENNNEERPDDEASGGAIVFTFANPTPVDYVEIIDIDINELEGFIECTDIDGVVTRIVLVAYGDNAYFRAQFSLINIVNVTVFFPGSGAISSIVFCSASAPISHAIGDTVWFDQNGNGIQEAYESTGVPGVMVQLHDPK